MKKSDTKKLSMRQRIAGIVKVAKITYKASPLAVFIKLVGTLITSILPIVTTYFAALTTTALAEAYSGDEAAGERAITFVIITAILGVSLSAWGSLENYINQLVRYKIDAAISDQLYEQFLTLDFWRYDDKKTADLFDKSKQFANYFAWVFDGLAGLLKSFTQLLAGLVALILVSWWLGLIVLVAVIPGVIIQFKLSKARIGHWNDNIETRRTKDMIQWKMMEVGNIAELRIYGLARHLLDLRMELRDKDEKTRIVFDRKFIPSQLGADILEAVAEVAALVYTTLQIIAQVQPIGQFLYVQQITSRALGGARSLVSGLSSMDEDIANLFDYNEFMMLPSASKRTKRLPEPVQSIQFQNVSFRYRGNSTTVLDDVSFTIQQGQHIAIVGENGAGKSTLIKLLLGLYRPTKGKVMLNEHDLAKLRLEDWHQQLGVLQQDFIQYGFASARDNVLFGAVYKGTDEAQFATALENAEAKQFLKKLPKGYDSFVHQWIEHNDGTPGVDLSGGQWQRLALARSFYRDSPIIILDEPTSAIDALAEARIFKRLFAKKDKTIITISHRLNTVKKADHIFVLEDGKIVEQGTHSQLSRKKKGAYYRLFESQL